MSFFFPGCCNHPVYKNYADSFKGFVCGKVINVLYLILQNRLLIFSQSISHRIFYDHLCDADIMINKDVLNA